MIVGLQWYSWSEGEQNEAQHCCLVRARYHVTAIWRQIVKRVCRWNKATELGHYQPVHGAQIGGTTRQIAHFWTIFLIVWDPRQSTSQKASILSCKIFEGILFVAAVKKGPDMSLYEGQQVWQLQVWQLYFKQLNNAMSQCNVNLKPWVMFNKKSWTRSAVMMCHVD